MDEHKKERDQAKVWLSGEEGNKALLARIIEDLMVNYQIEIAEGRSPGDDDKSRGVARQCRKQAKETAELIMSLTSQLKGMGG